MDKIPITADGNRRLNEELKNLKGIERPAIIRAIAEAREHGDLSENAEYHAARERQSFIEGRIIELENLVKVAEVVDPLQFSVKEVRFGAKVTLADEESDEEVTYQVVGEFEADIEVGRISITSPLGRALIGRGVGDSVEFESPRGTRYYEVVKIRYK